MDGTNYKEWAFDAGLVLKQNMCWSITTGIEKEPVTTASAEWLSWSQKKEIATSTIFLTMERRMQQNYMDFEDPHVLWEKIKSDYVTKIKKNAFTIRKELYEEDSEKMSNREHSFFLLNGIDAASPDWSVNLQLLHDRIESESLDKKPEDVLLKLIAREAELRKNKGISSDALLYTKGSNAKRRNNSNSDKKKKRCTYCERDRDDVSECFRKQRGEPPGGKSFQQTRGSKAQQIRQVISKGTYGDRSAVDSH